jgi:parvulin-like peptidyl-prolyl isomerase
VWGRLAEALSGAGRIEEAFDAVESGLKVSPRSADLIRLKVALLTRVGRAAEAAAFLEASVKANPKDGVLLAELANQRRNAGDLASAEALTARAVQLSPTASDAWVSRGLVLGALERIPDGASAFARARELDAGNVDAWFYGAVLEIRRGNGAAAIPLLSKTEALDPQRGGLREAKLAAVQAQSARIEPTPPPGALRLRLIRVSTRTAAEDALRRLTAGQDIAAVARAVSIDPTGPSGGDLGWVVPSELGEPLRSAVAPLRAGQVSPIVETSRGFVIVRRDP